MQNKIDMPIKRIFLISVIIGLLIAFGYEPLYFIISDFFQKRISISLWQEIASSAIIGIFYLGLLVYLIIILALGIFSKQILNYLIKELRYKELLPHSFNMKKKRNFKETYKDIINIFDVFIRNFILIKQDKDKFAKTVETYLDPSLTQEIYDRNINEIYLGGRKKTATILFADLRGFTALTENQDPNKVITILNQYLSASTKIIDNNKGKVNKFIGDAILAVFEEAPKYMNYLEADKAIIAALDIQTNFKILIKKWREEIDPLLDLGLGIGIARGEIIAGNIGSQERMEYTVIGDTVNLASRLCGIAKDGQVIISDYIYKLLENNIEVDVLPTATFKGKSGVYNIYSVKTRKMIV